jgi:hypothetical protein
MMTENEGLSPELKQLEKELARARRELAAVEASQERPLEEFFANLVAASNDIQPAEVTEEYILRQRDERVYPTARFNIHSPIGGYNGTRLNAFSREQIAALDKEVNRQLDAFLADAR